MCIRDRYNDGTFKLGGYGAVQQYAREGVAPWSAYPVSYTHLDVYKRQLEQLMMSQPGQKTRGGGIYRSPFHYTPKDRCV